MSQASQPLSSSKDHGQPSNEISPELLQLLVCPLDHGQLSQNGDGLTCDVCKRTYPVSAGIPNFVIEES